MKFPEAKVPTRLILALCVFCALCVLCGQLTAQDWRTLKDGVEYAEVTKEISGLKVNMNLLRLDLKKVRLDVAHAFDRAIGVDTTSNIAKVHGAFAAINGGFFRLDKSPFLGDPAGVLVVDGELYSDTPSRRTAVAFLDGKGVTDVLFEPIFVFPRISSKVEMPELNGINRERKNGESILYSRVFGRTTLTNGPGTEIIISRCKKFTCKEFQVMENVHDSVIPNDGYVLSMAPDVKSSKDFIEKFKSLSRGPKSGRRLLIQHVITPENFVVGKYVKGIYIVGGVPQLIKNGRVDITWQEEKTTRSFVETRHPRTAVAKLKDGKFLMITVDGRTESSGGIGLQDLAEYLLSLGATDAMNLDGGGSTTMFVDGKVVNHPSDKEGERKVSDALLVTLRTKAKK